MPGHLVLTLDGSTRVSSTALLRATPGGSEGDWEVLARKAEADGQGQAGVLLGMVDEMLAELDAAPGDLQAVVVGVGPGTFTGVRIAVATARGLALALSIPVWGVSTLAALAAKAAASAASRREAPWSRLVPVIDARRQQVFFGVYERSLAGEGAEGVVWTRMREFGVCGRGSFESFLREEEDGRALFIGEAMELVEELPPNAEFVSTPLESERLIVGQELLGVQEGLAAEPRVGSWLSGSAGLEASDGSPEGVKPMYVRAPDADVHITMMKDPWVVGSSRRR